jgi:hypothetical protein
MKTITRIAASTLALAAFAGAATAQVPHAPPAPIPAPAPRGPANPPGGQGADAPPDPVAYAEQNLTGLRTRLHIGPNEAHSWNSFVTAVLNQSRRMQAAESQQLPTSAPDRVARMAEMMRHDADDMASVSRALRTLYAGLNPGQRAILDQEFMREPEGEGGPGSPQPG